MRCEACDGSGAKRAPLRDYAYVPAVCPECNGSGITHCCEGLRACAELFDDYEGVE